MSSLNVSQPTPLYIMCVCVCVWERERERDDNAICVLVGTLALQKLFPRYGLLQILIVKHHPIHTLRLAVICIARLSHYHGFWYASMTAVRRTFLKKRKKYCCLKKCSICCTYLLVSSKHIRSLLKWYFGAYRGYQIN